MGIVNVKYSNNSSANGNRIFRAIQFTGDNIDECLLFCSSARRIIDIKPKLIITSGYMDMLCNLSDWIVEDGINSWSVCMDSALRRIYTIEAQDESRADIFKYTYSDISLTYCMSSVSIVRNIPIIYALPIVNYLNGNEKQLNIVYDLVDVKKEVNK